MKGLQSKLANTIILTIIFPKTWFAHRQNENSMKHFPGKWPRFNKVRHIKRLVNHEMLAVVRVTCEGPYQLALEPVDCKQKLDGHPLCPCTQEEVEKEFSGFCGTSTTTKSFLSHDMQNTV